jgi:glycerophosphoryl diester phosphodiesterase
MQAAFDRGADVVEFDITATVDRQFAVFHDRMLECRTDGHGLTREHTLQQLNTFDIGYGYTSDGGRTHPFRGKGKGLMPSMADVFEAFPNRAFLIDIKGNVPRDGSLLATHLSRLSPAQRSRLIVFGRDGALARLHDRLPDVRTFSVGSIANCLVRYIAYGWTGVVPGACDNAGLFVPVNIAPWLWGWPNLFMDRMKARGGSIVVVGPFAGGNFSTGLDTLEDLARLPAGYDGGIWTNDVELVTAAIKNPGRKQDSSLR